MAGIVMCFFSLLKLTTTNAQEIKIVPKNRSAAYLSRMSVSPSGSFIAVRLFEGQQVSIFESFSGKEINRIDLGHRPLEFYLLNDQYLLAVFNYNIAIISMASNTIVAEWKSDGMIFTVDFNFKKQVLAVSTLNNTTTINCADNSIKVLATITAKLSDHLSLSEDGQILAGLQEKKIICWNVNDLKLKGSFDTTGINSFEATSSGIIGISKNPYSYRTYNFDGTPISAYKEILDVFAPYITRLNSVEGGFFLEAYKKIVFIDDEGYQTILKTDDQFKEIEFNEATNKIITLGFDNISVMDFEGAVYTKIANEQVLPVDMYYDSKAKKNIIVLDSVVVFAEADKEVRRHKLNGNYVSQAIEKDNWIIVPLADGRISIWDIKKEKLLYDVKHGHIPYLIIPDQKNICLYTSGFNDSSVYRIDLKTGTKNLIYKDNSPVSAIAFNNENFCIGNINGEVKVTSLEGNRLLVKNSAVLFGNGISELAVVEDKLMAASYGRMGYLKTDLSDSASMSLFVGHNGFIKDMVISPDKRFFISSAQDKTIKLWDLEKNRLIQSYDLDSVNADRLQLISNTDFLFYGSGFLMGGITDSISVDKFMNPINEIVVQSPNNNSPLKMTINKEGTLLASVDNNTVKVRDLKSGFLISEFSTQSKTVNGITFTTDGKMIAVAAGKAVECFDPLTGKLIRQILLDKRNRSVHDVEAYNNAIVAINSHGWHNPLIIHKNSGLKLGEIWYNAGEKMDKRLLDFKCTPNGSLLITYGTEFIKVFENPEKPKNILTIPLAAQGKTNRNYIDFMNISPDGKYLLYDDFTDVSTLKIVEIAGGKLLKQHGGGIGAFGKDGKYIYVAGKNRVGLRNIYTDSVQILDFTCDGEINNIVYNDKADIFAVSDNWGNIKILEGRSGSIISENSRWDQYTYNSILSPNGRYLLFNNRWGLYTTDLNNLKRERIPAENYPLSAVFSPASDKLFFRNENTFYAKELATGNIDTIFTTSVNENDIQYLDISGDGKILYFGTADNDLIFIDIENRKQFWSMNKFKVKGWDGFVLRKMLFKEGRYQLFGAGIKTYGKESGLTYISLDADDKMGSVKRTPELKLRRGEDASFERVVFESDAKIFDVSPDGKYFCFMKDLELYIVDMKSGDTVFNRDNPISGNIQSGFFTADQRYFIIGMDDGYTEIYDLTKKGKNYSYGSEAEGLLRLKRFMANQSGVSNLQVAANRLLVKGNNAFISLFDTGNDFNKELDMDFIKDQDQIFINPEGYYYSTKNALNYIAFKRDVSIYPFDQLDIKYNRPDKVLESVHSKDASLISSYKMAYLKRIKRLNINESNNLDVSNIPQADFSNRLTIPFDQTTGQLKLNIKATDSKYALERMNIWVNNVPLWGMKGYNLSQKKQAIYDTVVSINLTKGKNKIEIAVTNSNGAESFKTPLIVNYSPLNTLTEKIYFIGIGIDRFADNKYDLQYSTKDIRDLSKKIKEKFDKNIIIDTLFNENVTISNVKALKQKLLQTTANDKVIISYSGHGMLSKDFDYYLSTYAVNFNKPEENGLAYDELENLLDSIPARKKLLLIDACHSGEVDKEDLVALNETSDTLIKGIKPVAYKKDGQLGLKNSFELMQSIFVNVGKSTGATIISAAAGTQFALERSDLKNGVFTYSILEAMNKYPTMKISELKTIVGKRVEELTKGLQKPTSRNETLAVDWNVW